MNPVGRTVGRNAAQNAELAKDVADMQAKNYRDIRVDQQQVNAAQERVGINRPDLQGTSPRGVREIVEYDTHPSPRAAGHKARIEANDPKAKVTLKEFP
jgi:hypothetical protein